jgi:hypothetical protein
LAQYPPPMTMSEAAAETMACTARSGMESPG